MKMISWNVNGLRACVKKGFAESMLALNADVICLQETKLQKGQENIELDGYQVVYNTADKKGYSGTAVFSRVPVISSAFGIGVDEHDHEGRVITTEFESFYLVSCYTPNSQRGLARLPYRMEWEDAFLSYIKSLEEAKPVIICGDLNVAHNEIDLKNPKTNHDSAGFTDDERAKFSALLDSGYVDSFRYLHPNEVKYSWWSYIGAMREKNVGWRIDYFAVSKALSERILSSDILTDILGSDHCPIELVISDN